MLIQTCCYFSTQLLTHCSGDGKTTFSKNMVLDEQPVATSLPDHWMKGASILEQITRNI